MHTLIFEGKRGTMVRDAKPFQKVDEFYARRRSTKCTGEKLIKI